VTERTTVGTVCGNSLVQPLIEGRRRLSSGDPNYPTESWGSKSVNSDSEPRASRAPPYMGE
jgi:hypothetical protein